MSLICNHSGARTGGGKAFCFSFFYLRQDFTLNSDKQPVQKIPHGTGSVCESVCPGEKVLCKDEKSSNLGGTL